MYLPCRVGSRASKPTALHRLGQQTRTLVGFFALGGIVQDFDTPADCQYTAVAQPARSPRSSSPVFPHWCVFVNTTQSACVLRAVGCVLQILYCSWNVVECVVSIASQ